MFKEAFLIVILVLSLSPQTFAQEVVNEDGGDGSSLPGPKSILVETCTVGVLNRTAFPQFDGSFTVRNVPAGAGLLRARVTCTRGDGATIIGETGLSAPIANGQTSLGPLTLGGIVTPIADALSLTTSKSTLTSVGDTAQLTVTALYDDSTQADVTAEPDTVYTTSNPNIATVSNVGLVAAVSPGTVVLSASKDGVIAATIVSVDSGTAGDSDGDSMPDDY